MKPFTFLALRRIAAALESIAASQAELARVAVDDWSRRSIRAKPAKVEFGIMDPSEVDKLYNERAEKEALGEYEDETVETE